jgi:hypothetical protein
LNTLLNKGDEKKICRGGVVVEASDDVEVEVLAVDMAWVQAENVSVQTVDTANLIN